MKKILLFLFALSLSSGFVGIADATIIDFDLLTPGNYPSLVFPEVTITELDGGNVNVLAGGSGGTGYTSPFNNIAASQWTVGYGLLFTFTNLVSNVSLTGGDAGNDTDRWSLEAFDSGMTSIGLVDTGDFVGPDSPAIPGTTFGDYRTLVLNLSGIKYVKAVQLNWGSAWDDLRFDDSVSVPEPTAMILLGLGLFGLAVTKKNFIR